MSMITTYYVVISFEIVKYFKLIFCLEYNTVLWKINTFEQKLEIKIFKNICTIILKRNNYYNLNFVNTSSAKYPRVPVETK